MTRRAVAERQLRVERELLARAPGLPDDVRENHVRTITMRVRHYENRIALLDAQLAADEKAKK